jgi:hypothetical protein
LTRQIQTCTMCLSTSARDAISSGEGAVPSGMFAEHINVKAHGLLPTCYQDALSPFF